MPLLQIKDEAEFNAALAKLAAGGALTPEQVARVKEEWKKRR
jgi:hypothetical protein